MRNYGNASYSSNWEQVTIIYLYTLEMVAYTGSKSNSNAFCKYILSDVSFTKLGTGSSCTLNNNSIIVDLGKGHEFSRGGNIEVENGTIYSSLCYQFTPNSEVHTFTIADGNLSLTPKPVYSGTEIFYPCAPVHLVLEATNVGNTNYFITWKLINMTAPIDAGIISNIESYLNKAVNKASYTIPRLTLLPPNDYNLEVSVKSFWGVQSEIAV
jgi:hypothetical protein